MDIKRKCYLITGASSGIGRALAFELASGPVKLILQGRNRDRLEKVVADCRGKGAVVHEFVADVRDELFSKQVLSLDERYGIDVVVANAGINSTLLPDQEPEDFELVLNLIDTNLKGVINTVNPLIANMKKRRSGKIILMSSIAAFRGLPQCPAYCAAKSAVLAYGESLRAWLRHFGVNVAVICPGFIETPLCDKLSGPKPFLMSPEKAAKIIVKGMANNKQVIAFPRLLVLASKFSRLLPAKLVDYFLFRIESSIS